MRLKLGLAMARGASTPYEGVLAMVGGSKLVVGRNMAI